jgi:integrase
MARKQNLTDRLLRSLKPDPRGPYDGPSDTVVPGLIPRVMPSGQITFTLRTRYPGTPVNPKTGLRNPTRRALDTYSPPSPAEQAGAQKSYESLRAKERERLTFEQFLLQTYGATTLAGAREKGRTWLALIKRGVDPQHEEARRKRVEERTRANTFGSLAEDFIADKLPSERKGREVERDIRREFIPAWGGRPITDIEPIDVRAVIKAVKDRPAPAQARNLLGIAKRLFAWAVDQQCYGITVSPAATLKPTKIIGDKISGVRVLNDDEIFALWRAATRTPYPHGPVYQLLILTALRLNEAADASWPEFDLTNRLWTIPASRMKGKNGKARAHVVPLTSEIIGILETLPRFKRERGQYLFSTTFGASPAWMSDKVKRRIDGRMLRTLRALARRRGDDPSKVVLAAFTNHDIRRTIRSRLSRLKITEEAREAVLAHVRPGIKGTYDHHDYLDEKREALVLWANRLREIVEPPPANVVAIQARG